MGKFDPDAHADFESIPIQYADREGMYIRKDVFTAYKKMYEAAKKDGVNLQIRSATRNFFYQKGIWERKWRFTLSMIRNLHSKMKIPYELLLTDY